ncbi:MAG: ArsR/SmtB family transcription factor [Candidatus Bipolaricaulia bacterium]
MMEEYTEIFKALGDGTRLRIIHLLVSSGLELCCCELTDSLEEPQYNVSRHLKVLKSAGLVKERKEGRWVYYAAREPVGAFEKAVFAAIASLPQTERLSRDQENLTERLKLRVGGRCVLGVRRNTLSVKG